MNPVKFFVITALTAGAVSCSPHSDNVNQAPVAEAGPSQSIILPANQLTLQGSGYDPDGDVTGYSWTQVSGPGNASFGNAADPASSVTGLVQGNYTFRLTVTDDDGATGSDTVTMYVLPATVHSVTVQPDHNPMEKQIGIKGNTEWSFPDAIEEVLTAWTVNGEPNFCRSAVKFDLSGIPSSATVLSATLYLYSDPNPNNANQVDANFGSDNSFTIRRISAPWTITNATWANQPATATNNMVTIPHTSLSMLDVTADVTAMVNDMVHNGNYGFFMKLQNEVQYTSRLFISSYHQNTAKHPKLVIQYQ